MEFSFYPLLVWGGFVFCSPQARSSRTVQQVSGSNLVALDLPALHFFPGPALVSQLPHLSIIESSRIRFGQGPIISRPGPGGRHASRRQECPERRLHSTAEYYASKPGKSGNRASRCLAHRIPQHPNRGLDPSKIENEFGRETISIPPIIKTKHKCICDYMLQPNSHPGHGSHRSTCEHRLPRSGRRVSLWHALPRPAMHAAAATQTPTSRQ